MTLTRPALASELTKPNKFEVNKQGYNDEGDDSRETRDADLGDLRDHGSQESGDGKPALRKGSSLEPALHVEHLTRNHVEELLNEDSDQRKCESFVEEKSGRNVACTRTKENQEEFTGSVEEVSLNIKEVSLDVEEVSLNVREVSFDVEEVTKEQEPTANDVLESFVFTFNNNSGRKLGVINKDDAEIYVSKAERALPVVVITMNDEGMHDRLVTQRPALDVGFNEPLYKHNMDSFSDGATSESAIPRKSMPRVGPENGTESEGWRGSSLEDPSTYNVEEMLTNGCRQVPGNNLRDNASEDNSDVGGKSNRVLGDMELDGGEKGFLIVSGHKLLPVHTKRSFSVEDGNHSEPASNMKALQDVHRPVSFSDDNIDVAGSAAESGQNSLSSASSGIVGILKKPSSYNRSEVYGSDRSIDRDTLLPAVNMSEGLRRYRRRSHLSISPEIPADASLKTRQIESEQRNKDNLEFIKRRISLQNEPSLGAGEAERTPEVVRRSLPTYINVDGHSQDHIPYFEQTWRHSGRRSPSAISNDVSPNGTPRYERHNGAGHAAVCSGRLSRNNSFGEQIVVEKELNDDEINDCLGNISPSERINGTPSFPTNLEQPGADLQPHNGSVGYDDDLAEPYVPVKKQRTLSDKQTKRDTQNIAKRMPVTEPLATPVRSPSNLPTTLVPLDYAFLSSLSLAGQLFAGSLRKDSLALFNHKLNGIGPGPLRRFSQASIAEFEELRRKHKKLTKVELLKSFRLHFFVGLIFIIITVSVSLSWHYKNEAQEKLYSSQAIFFNPRTRELTLSDFSKSTRVRGILGKDIPEWMLPLHCPIVMGDDPHNKECLWKKVAILKVSHFQEKHQQVQCYNVTWQTFSDKHLPHDCIYIDHATWYGPSNQSSSTFPIQGAFVYNPRVYKLNNNGLFNNVVDFYWLSSIGTAIYVNANNPIQVAWNISGSNQLCLKSNFSGSLYHQSNSVNLPGMSYTLCQGTNAVKTHMFMQTMFAPQTPIEFPHTSMLSGTHWSLRKIVKTDNVSQSHVTHLVREATAKGFSNNVITMDGAWQKSHGDLDFDMDRFPNVTEMTEVLNATDCLLTLCVSPYFQYRSRNFHTGAITKMFVRDAGGDVTGLTNFEGGQAAILDFFSESGRTWYNKKLQNLTKTHQIESYRLTYGQHSWLPYKPYFDELNATPNMYRKLFTEQLSALVNLSLIVEHTSDSRHISSLISVSTRLSANRKCLTGTIETALALGLIGYPFVMADGISVESNLSQAAPEVDNKPSRELYIRWLQLAALFPAYQYSIAPWEYDSDVVSIATNLSVLHTSFVLKEMRSKKLQEEVAHGLPILRPVWWLDSDNHTLHAEGIHDEFLIGDNLLVAPVLCEGVSERDIFIPSGYWQDVNDDKSFTEGPQHISKHPVILDNIVMFKKIPVRGRGQAKMEL